MDKVRKIEIDPEIIKGTNDELRRYGRNRFEGLVLWLGEIRGDTAIVKEGMVPPQAPISNESGVGYLVSSDTLDELNRYLHKTGWRLIAQIHSHPTRAYHSPADDQYAIATKEGSLSIVVPNFAMGPASLKQWAVYRLWGGSWTEQSLQERNELFAVAAEEKPKSMMNRLLDIFG